MNVTRYRFDKNAAQYVKAIAISLMLLHHLWGFPSWVLDSNRYVNSLNGLEHYISDFGKICVGIFAYISGYAFFVKRSDYLPFKPRIEKMFRFLLKYWVICIFFISVGFSVSEPLPKLSVFIANCFGIATMVFDYGNGSVNVCMAWYVAFYISVLFLLPLLILSTKKSFIVDSIIYLLVFRLILFADQKIDPTSVLPGFAAIHGLFIDFCHYAPIVAVGYFSAQYDIHTKVARRIKGPIFGIALSMAIFAAVALARYRVKEVFQINLDAAYSPLTVISLTVFYGSIRTPSLLKKAIEIVGTQSMNIWLIHGIFFLPYRKIQWLAYWPGNSVLIFFWVLLLTTATAVLISTVQNRLDSSVMRLSRSLKIRGAKKSEG